MTEFTQEQKEEIKKYAIKYKNWLSSPDGVNNIKEHRDAQRFFQEKLSLTNLEKMTGNEFREIYKRLWASNIWGNKDWYIDNKLIAPNGFEKIKRELKKLLYETEEIDTGYDIFRENVKGFGPSSLTEILHFVFPDKYCLWNEKPKTVLPFLALDILPEKFYKYQIANGKEYLQCNQALSMVREELENCGLEISDFIDVDLFLWYIFDDIMPKIKKEEKRVKGEVVKPKEIKISSHDAAEFYLLELGELLGYNTYVTAKDRSRTYQGTTLGDIATLKEIPTFAGERDLNSAREIDVIWFDDSENPRYCFEVEHTMDILRSLNRLFQLKHFRVNFLIVSPKKKKSKFDIEMSKFPFRQMRDIYRFVSYDELVELYESALPHYQLKKKLLGE